MPSSGVEGWGVPIGSVMTMSWLLSCQVSTASPLLPLWLYPQLWEWLLKSPTAKKVEARTSEELRQSGWSVGQWWFRLSSSTASGLRFYHYGLILSTFHMNCSLTGMDFVSNKSQNGLILGSSHMNCSLTGMDFVSNKSQNGLILGSSHMNCSPTGMDVISDAFQNSTFTPATPG